MGSKTGGAMSGAASGAATGALIGGPAGALIGGIGGAVLGFFQGKSANDAEKTAQLMYNEWLKDRSQTAEDIAAKLAANGIDIYGPQVTTTSQNGQSLMNQVTRSSSVTQGSSRPVITSEYQPMEEQFRKLIRGRLGAPSAVSDAEILNAVRGINQAYAGGRTAATNMAARFGLGGNQALGLATPGETARSGAIATYLGTTVPNEARSRQNQDLAMAQGAINAFGKGEQHQSATQGTSSTSGSTTSTGGSTTTAPPNYASLFNMLAPPSPYMSGQTGQNPYLNAGQDLLSVLAGYYANKPAGGPGVSTPTTPYYGPQYV